MDTLIDLENKGWKALSSDGNAGRQFYEKVLHDDAMMLFPGGMRLAGKANILESISSQPWKSFVMEKPEVISVSEQVKILTYGVSAEREGAKRYKALISSTYIQLGDEWKLIFHQQTPE